MLLLLVPLYYSSFCRCGEYCDNNSTKSEQTNSQLTIQKVKKRISLSQQRLGPKASHPNSLQPPSPMVCCRFLPGWREAVVLEHTDDLDYCRGKLDEVELVDCGHIGLHLLGVVVTIDKNDPKTGHEPVDS